MSRLLNITDVLDDFAAGLNEFWAVPVTLLSTLLKRISRQSVVSYFLYVVIPYCVSIAYTFFGLLFPQVHIISRVIQVLLHPIKWVLGIAEQVDRRAGPIRQVVEVFSPGGERRNPAGSARRRSTSSIISNAERANDQRTQCCICLYREKTILLRPCNHICLCNTCFQAVKSEQRPNCPICRTEIESHMEVYL
ncbi:RING-type domain-containing protein [Trichostrongylus colubriformis]|uniref:RING-type domain-containing protein n=1 Tax=Trichostrongylus colubriformis TaxID=6319 RepID=A0AAN8II33_TRICO